jgi:hypothetical protein
VSSQAPNFDILESLRGSFLTVELNGKGTLKRAVKYDQGAAAIQAARGGDGDAFSVSIKLYPKGFNEGIGNLTKAHGAVRAAFYKGTAPYARSGDGAAGKRLLASDPTVSAKFFAEHQTLLNSLDAARFGFAAEIGPLVHRLEAHARATSWLDFSVDNYPTAEDIRESYQYDPLVVEPIASAQDLSGVGLTAELAERVRTQMAQRAAFQYKAGLGQEARSLMELLKTMAGNLGKYAEHLAAPEDTRGRAPAVYDSLFTNVSDLVAKIRTYAIPETEDGSTLLALADQAQDMLRLGEIGAEHVKGNAPLARQQAKAARVLSAAIESTDFFSS